jgi:hypothetical protein
MRVIWLALLLSLISIVVIRAEPPNDVLAFLQNAADALTNEDARTFLGHVDRDMPGYAILQANIEGLMAAYDVESSIEVVNDQGDDRQRSLTLDWVLITEEKAATRGDRATRRRLVNCQIERRGKQWKIIALAPLDFFKY